MREETLRFESYDLSASGFGRPSAVLRRMQQTAREDLNSFGITYYDLRAKNMAFVVSRMALIFERPVPGETPLTLCTAPGESRGAAFPRSFVLTDEKGVVMRAMSIWALLDFEKRALLRASALEAPIPVSADLSDGVVCERLTKPREGAPLYTQSRPVYPSMLDQNCHLNNCNYADLATDLLPAGSGEVREMQLSFQREARLGDTLTVEGYADGDSLLVSGAFSDREEVSFLCRIRTF